MKQQTINQEFEQDLPECAFRFNYLQAQQEDYAERLVEDAEDDK